MSEILHSGSLQEEQKWQQIGTIIRKMLLAVYGGPLSSEWSVQAENVETLPEYYGISVSNGVIGAVSSRSPFKLSSTVLAGVYDKIGRGRVDNLVQTFPALNVEMSFGGKEDCYNFAQELRMDEGRMTNTFSGQSVSVSYTYYALRNLPFVFFTEFEVSAHEEG